MHRLVDWLDRHWLFTGVACCVLALVYAGLIVARASEGQIFDNL